MFCTCFWKDKFASSFFFIFGIIVLSSCKTYEDGGKPSKAHEKIQNRWELIGVWFNDIYKPVTRLDLELDKVKSLYWEVYYADDKKGSEGKYATIVEDKTGVSQKNCKNEWKLVDDNQQLILNAKNHPLRFLGIDSTFTEKKFKIIKLKYNKTKHVGEFIYAITYDDWTYKFVFRPD